MKVYHLVLVVQPAPIHQSCGERKPTVVREVPPLIGLEVVQRGWSGDNGIPSCTASSRPCQVEQVDEIAAAGPDAEPAVVVEITPRDYRRRSLFFIVGGLLLTAVSIWLDVGDDRSGGNPVVGLMAIGYGIYCQVQARHQVTRNLLRIDRSGIRSADGLYDQTWNGVVMVWVGSSTGLRLPLVGQPVLSVFTQAGLDFAGRAGTRPKARYSVPVGPPWTVRELSSELSMITSASVTNGHQVSRASAAAALQQSSEG